jgi:chromosome segregation ATPase
MPNDSNSPTTPEPNAPETGNASGSGSPDILVAITAASKEAETFLQQVRDAQSEEKANYEQLRSDLEGAVNGFQSRVKDITSELTSPQLDERVRGLEAIISTIQNVAGGLFGQSTTADSEEINRPANDPGE